MAHPGIFLLQGSGLSELREHPYEAEELLQRLLADYPDLLAGDQMTSNEPRRWLLVGRETAIPSEEAGAGRWALDHLFLDQDGVPTLVEVKRSTDTRIRREVVGQMLDYAANAVVYWPPDLIRSQFELRCESEGLDSDEVIKEVLGPEIDHDLYWQSVVRNLQAGRIRMVFVADVIPDELRRIVEFLNGQMNPAEVLAIEIRQYVGEGLTALVPRVVGQTALAQSAKSPARVGVSTRRRWDENAFFADLGERKPSAEVAVARAILDWSKQHDLDIWWGKGANDGSFFPGVQHGGRWTHTISVWTYGRLEVQFSELAKPSGGPFHSEAKRAELLERFRAIPGIDIRGDLVTLRRPSIPLSALTQPGALEQFLSVLSWMVNEIRSSSVSNPSF